MSQGADSGIRRPISSAIPSFIPHRMPRILSNTEPAVKSERLLVRSLHLLKRHPIDLARAFAGRSFQLLDTDGIKVE